MSYREEDGQVVLTMSREDYDWLVDSLKFSIGLSYSTERLRVVARLLDDWNSGNPHYTPYQVEGKKS